MVQISNIIVKIVTLLITSVLCITNRTSKKSDIWADSRGDSSEFKTKIRNSFVFSKTAFIVFGIVVGILGILVLMIGVRALVLAFYTNFFMEETPPVFVAAPVPPVPDTQFGEDSSEASVEAEDSIEEEEKKQNEVNNGNGNDNIDVEKNRNLKDKRENKKISAINQKQYS